MLKEWLLRLVERSLWDELLTLFGSGLHSDPLLQLLEGGVRRLLENVVENPETVKDKVREELLAVLLGEDMRTQLSDEVVTLLDQELPKLVRGVLWSRPMPVQLSGQVQGCVREEMLPQLGDGLSRGLGEVSSSDEVWKDRLLVLL